MLVVGVTGLSSSGKSTVCRYFNEFGAVVSDADALVHELLASDPETQAAIETVFGKSVRQEDGSINRKTLGSLVFTDPAKLHQLESILHPRVRQRFATLREELSSAVTPPALLVIEVPLLFENGFDSSVDYTVTVACDEAERRERFEARGLEDYDARIARQLSQNEKIQRADFVLYNSGNKQALRESVEALHQRLQGLQTKSNDRNT